MASVSSLDKDLRQLRLDKYTPQAAKEVRDWIEDVLGDKLQSADLLDALKDGLVLCRLVNKAVTPGVKSKQSNMPFVQRENISHFVRACQMPPLGLPDHDIFLTDDLYEQKDPAQVLQCIVAFSRRAKAVNPTAFPRAIGARSKASVLSPQLSGTSQGGYTRAPIGMTSRDRGSSNASDSSATTWNPLAKGSYSGRISPTKGAGSPPGNVTSWSRKGDEGSTAPAWNIHQYGYMGGASQGNQGISFGARRQITSAAPTVPSLGDKERRRKEEEKEAQRQRAEAEEAEQKRQLEREAEEERKRLEEERQWQEETRRLRGKEKQEAEEEKRRWEEEQQRWKEEEEEARLREERELHARQARERNRKRSTSDARLRGQFLSQYQAEQNRQLPIPSSEPSRTTSESQRIRELERQLELAKERERQYEMERQERLNDNRVPNNDLPDISARKPSSNEPRPPVPPQMDQEDDRQVSEREYLEQAWQNNNMMIRPQEQPAPPNAPKLAAAKPLPPARVKADIDKSLVAPSRPLPDPAAYAPNLNRTDRYLSTNPAPVPVQVQSHRTPDYSTTTEVDLENQRRKESQAKTKAGGWASKSLLEREMERERERQREWEESQKQTATTPRDKQEGLGPGQSWDVHQYGYTGGDSQNRGGPGLGVGGARRQIIGPRPPPR